ncbi:hypothetical protein TRM7557_01327 [Tritonibacter multivorans]|uniref:Rod shape-determining protein MreD n=1 Tax=Tritonibacter multivorans TaxID=928856 RepID=A0A0P1G6W6_9RHOB|nr:hypothetical protein [Tritonibacter multivorans]MDA7422789.1 rod shape-determining protein MreD [Tritonibacter multivorans]CUH77342.1 hypothetical protein TRM7557_01327 [Tritonibacter multivorans]SFD59858.1 rod shape-determining protein MreD [Tritonibacter multivorans]
MAKTSPTAIWLMRLGFAGVALLVVFFHLLPLNTLPVRWPPPDFLAALCLAWALRRPEFVPALLIAAVMLMGDLLLQRPPGLWALLVLLACEFLKVRMPPQHETPFLGEWTTVAITLTIITLMNRMILGVLGVEQANLAPILVQGIMTLIAYPFVVLISQSLLGVRRLTPAEIEAMGARS